MQLAEAILLDDDDEDSSSILLDDARSRRISSGIDGQDHERQFLVGGDEEEEDALADEVRSFRSSVSMDEEREQQKGKLGLLMNNASARMSHLDVHASQDEGEGSQHEGAAEGKKPKNGGLAAKAGIILVCCPADFQSSSSVF